LKPWVLAAQGILADGPLVVVNHDADRLTFCRRAGWRCAGGGCGEKLGEQGILFSYRAFAVGIVAVDPVEKKRMEVR
jgi:hypothetical protein